MRKNLVCKEMRKLRRMLKRKGIEFEKNTEIWDMINREMYICRTYFRIGEKNFSVVNGFGTYGGFDYWDKDNKGLLELWNFDSDPIGYLTAKQVMKEVLKGGSESEDRRR